MTREEYKAQREALIAQAHEAESRDDAEGMNTLMDAVEKLDKDFRNAVIAAKNEKALAAEPEAVDIKNMAQPVAGGKVVETMNSKDVIFTAESREFHDAFLKNLMGKELSENEMKAAAFVGPGVIPTETVNKIYGKLKEAPLLAAINLMHIPGNLSIPVADTVNEASWVAMGSAATDSEDKVETVSFGAYKLIKTVEITADIESMSIPEFEAWLVNQLSKKIRTAADAGVLTGTGTNQSTGILKAGAVTNAKTFTTTGMTYKDLMAIIGALPSQYLPYAKFVMPSALFWSDVEGMTDTAGKPICVSDPAAPAQYRIKGFPAIIDDNCTADNLVFGDLEEGYTFNFSKDPTVDRDKSVGFRSGSIVFRGMALADGKVVNKDALVKASRASA